MASRLPEALFLDAPTPSTPKTTSKSTHSWLPSSRARPTDVLMTSTNLLGSSELAENAGTDQIVRSLLAVSKSFRCAERRSL